MAAGPDGRWTVGIGDPTLLGWVTVAAYAAAALLAWRNVGAARRTAVPHGFWIALTTLMLALGLNKQLDLQTWLSQAGRDLAIAQGWWEQRRVVQAVFIALLAAGAVGVVVWARRQWHTLWHEYRAAFVGVCVLLFFIVVRAASFHHIDMVLRTLSSLHEQPKRTGWASKTRGPSSWNRRTRRSVGGTEGPIISSSSTVSRRRFARFQSSDSAPPRMSAWVRSPPSPLPCSAATPPVAGMCCSMMPPARQCSGRPGSALSP